MKRVILILIFATFLTACGGGGGNTPTVQMPDNPPGQTDNGGNDDMQTDDGENDNPQMDDMQTDNGENDNPQMDDMQTDDDSDNSQMDDMQTDNGENDSPVKSEYDDDEFNANYSLRQMGALYAYENGYFGQSVTIGISEYIRETHEELAANVISLTTTIAGFGKQPSNTNGHGTRVIGVAIAARNGKGFHGVAPQAKFISYIGFGVETNRAFYMEQGKGIRIFNSSVAKSDSESSAAFRASLLAGLDIVHVNGLGNTTTPINSRGARMFPIYEPSLEPQWIVVAGLNEDDTLDEYSLECGEGKMWCISAYSDGFPTTNHNSDTDTTITFGGTSIATPQVSGALAVLKSAAPEIPITMIRQILLTTATDLGEEGIDEVFGWGLVNISAGIDHIENLEMANGMAYSDLRKSLPSEFSHLRGRLSEVSVALKITDDSYYNIPLSDIVGGDSQKTKLGNAAKEMQADDSLSPENSGFGFNYANGDYDLHYAGGGNENAFRFSGGLRHDDSQSSYIGEGGGIFSAENASDTGGYVKWTTKDYGGISAFGEYGRTQIKADYDSASFISQIKNARAEEWTAGFQYRDLFLHNDSLQFSARQESRISGGEMVLHYPIADGDSHKAFIGESVQTIRTETAKIPIKQKPQTIYTAGYSQKTENSKWSAAAEWNTATNAKGVSFAIELQIR